MEPIRNFAQLTAHLKTLNKRKRIAVVCANDPNTEYAISRALEEGIAEFLMIGDSAILEKYPWEPIISVPGQDHPLKLRVLFRDTESTSEVVDRPIRDLLKDAFLAS